MEQIKANYEYEIYVNGNHGDLVACTHKEIHILEALK